MAVVNYLYTHKSEHCGGFIIRLMELCCTAVVDIEHLL
jgi:hypothetical protein